MNLKTLGISLLGCILLLSGCDQQDSKQAENTAHSEQMIQQGNFQVSGVATKGPIQNATVEIYQLDNNGVQTGSVITSTTTDTNGQWQVAFGTAPTEPTMVIVSGGNYIDEADPATDKRTIVLGSNESLKGILMPGYTTASVNMLTNALLEKSRIETTAGNFQDVLNNNRNTAVLALGFDPFTVAAADPLSPSTSASNDSIEYAMYLGGLATALNSAAITLGQPVADYNILMGLVDDLSDGMFNGKKFTETVTVSINGTAQDLPANIDLNLAIQRFRNNNFAAYSVTDVSDIVTVDEQILSVAGTNVAPTAVDDTATTVSGVTINLDNVLANDTDPDGDQLSVSGFTQPTNGSITETANGLFQFVPASGFVGNTVFSYTASDNRGGESSAQVLITITEAPVVQPPVTENITPTADAGADQTVDEQTTVNLSGTGTDSDGTISSYLWTQISGTTVILNNANSATTSFDVPDLISTDVLVFSLTVTDNDGASAIDTVNIIANAIITSNAAPTVNAGVDQSVDEQSPVTLSGSASDSDGSIVSYQWSQISGPTVSLNNASSATATFTSLTVLKNELDVLVFQLLVTDNLGAESSDFVTVITNPVLVPPVADAGIDQTLDEGPTVTINLDGSGSTDDGTIASYNWTQVAGSPTVTLSDSAISNPDFLSPDVANDTTFTFQLTITDNEDGTDTDLVNITLRSLNSGPLVNDDPSNTTAEDTAVLISSLLTNDSDAENNSFTLNSVTQPSNGSVVIESNKLDVTYTPNANFNGNDSFSYTAIDEFGAISTNSATVTVSVTGVNDNPVAVSDTDSVVQGFSVTLSNLTANDTDLENDTLSITGVSQPANGVAVNNGDGSVTYTPDLSFSGTDSFTYNIVDNGLPAGNATGTVTITVIADTDGDGIVDTDEVINGTDPNLADSDNDGFYDGHELVVGSNPNLNTDFPPTTVIVATANNNVIDQDTTWTLAGAPYWLQSDVTVQAGATLTIEPGVVIKSNTGVDLFVNTGATLESQGNAPVPQHIVFTSALDDSINGDTNGDGIATTQSDNDWNGIDFNENSTGTLRYGTVKYGGNCFGIYNSSPIIDNVEVGDCQYYGFDIQTTSSTHTVNLSKISLNDYDSNGQSTGYSGIRLYVSGSATAVLNINEIMMTEPGSSGHYGLYLNTVSSTNMNGSVDNITITNAANDGINILNSGSGNMNLSLSNLQVDNSGSNAIDVRNTSTGTLLSSFDGANSFSNTPASASAVYFELNDPDFLTTGTTVIDTAGYGLQLNGSNGSFRNISINNTSVTGLLLANSSDPAAFSNITLTNAATPYQLNGQNITPTISAGYDFSDATVDKSYIRLGGTLLNDMSLTPDPLGTGQSVWSVFSNITIPSAITLTIEDGAIVKFASGLLVTVNGSLVTGDGDGVGNKAILTSFRDDAVGAPIGDGIAADRFDWNYISLADNSVTSIDNAIIRYGSRAIYQYYSRPTSLTITNTDITDIYYYGIELYANSGDNASLNLDTVNFDRVGVNTSYHGIYTSIVDDATLTGNWTNLTLNNIGGSGIYIADNSTGAVTPTISGLTIGNTGTIGSNGVQLIGDATTTPVINGSVATNTISAGNYNLTLQGVSGSYSNLLLENAVNASIYISDSSNPTSWDDNTIFLNSAPSPYYLLTDFPSSIGVYGTADIGYNAASTVTMDYVTTGGTLSNIHLAADPLNTGNSVYYVISNISVPTATTLTIDDGAIVKFASNLIITVNGSLVIGDGDGLGNKAILTSFRDDSVGAAISDGTAANRADWNYITLADNSVTSIDNAIIRYGQRAIYQYYSQPTSLSITNTDITDVYYHGIELYANTGDNASLDLNSVNFDRVGVNTSYHGIYTYLANDATLTGNWINLTFNNIGGSGIYIDDNSTGAVTPTISGLTIGNTGTIGRNGLQLIGNATTTPIIDGSVASNTISAGNYNLTLQGVGGSYSNLLLENAGTASVYLSDDSNPTSWDDSTILLNTSPSPYYLLSDFPASMGVFGTTDLGFNASSTVTKDYVITGGTLTSTNMVPDPLNSTNSIYYIFDNITIPTATTLTIADGTILKFFSGRLITVNGSLIIGDGDGLGNKSILTSFRDDTVGAAISDGTAANWNDWNYITPADNSVTNIDNAIIRYGSRAIYQYYSRPTSLTISNTDISDIYYYGIELNANTGDNVSLDLDTVSFDRVGLNNSYHGIYTNIDNDATLSGSWTNITLNNIGGSGIYIDDSSTGAVTPTISGLTIGDSGTIGRYGIVLIGDTTTAPVIDDSTASNYISGGIYNLYLDGVAGTYINLTLDNASTAAVNFRNGAAPSIWSAVTIDNTLTPYHLIGMTVPTGVSYTSTGGISESYIRLSGPIDANITLTADPLGLASGSGLATDPTTSYWYVPETLQNNSILDIEQDALIKFNEATYLNINAGATLNVNGTAGHEVYMTSFSDDVVGDPTTSVAVANDWYGIRFKTSSLGGNLDYLQNWYAYYAVYFESPSVDPIFNNTSIHYPLYGLFFSASTAIAPDFTDITIDQASNQGIYFTGSGAMNPTFSGTKIITGASTDCIYNTSSSPNIAISGWTLDGCGNGIDTRGAGVFVDNLIRNSSGSGMYVSTSSAVTIGNNRIVNNGAPTSYGGGIDIRQIGATSVIENNLIRHNRATYGGGIYFNGASAGSIDLTMRNNLILQNQATTDVGGVYVYDFTTLQLINNTIAGNTVSSTNDVGSGLFIQDISNNVTYTDNIIANNSDQDSLENINDLSTGSVENYNLEDGNSTNGLTGANSQLSTDPLFVEGWYLDSVSPAVDGGSDLPNNLGLAGTTTQVDGTLDGLATGGSDMVDLGYHYTTGSTAVSGTNSTVLPVSPVSLGLSETVTFTITPLDSTSAVIGAGLDIQISATLGNGTVGRLIDLGDGTYQVSFTSTSASSSETLIFTVNGVVLSEQPSINW